MLFQKKTRVYLVNKGVDGFGYVRNINLLSDRKNIGSIVFRKKTYLSDIGYPLVLELHIGFKEEYQRKGFFEDAIIELLIELDKPIYIASGRVINNDVFKAINKLDKSLLNVKKIEEGFIITLI